MPAIGDIAININNGETMMCISRCVLKFKHNNTIIEQCLTQEQNVHFIDIISQRAKEKHDQIEEEIILGFEEVIK